MRVTVLMFAGARDAVGADEVEIEIPDGASFAMLGHSVAASHPRLAPLLTTARFAADARYTSPDETVDPTQEIALIPAVSGG